MVRGKYTEGRKDESITSLKYVGSHDNKAYCPNPRQKLQTQMAMQGGLRIIAATTRPAGTEKV